MSLEVGDVVLVGEYIGVVKNLVGGRGTIASHLGTDIKFEFKDATRVIAVKDLVEMFERGVMNV